MGADRASTIISAMKAVRLIISIVGVLALSQCSLPDFPLLGSRSEIVRRPLMVMPSSASQSPLYVWHGGGQPGPLSLNIDLSEQKAYLFKNGESVGWTFVASGRSEFPTPTGSFRILEKIISKRSNRYGVIADSSGRIVNGSTPRRASLAFLPAGASSVPGCLTGCASPAMAWVCMPGRSPDLDHPPPTVASACRVTWRRRSTSMPASARG
jgi:hypothetical protein